MNVKYKILMSRRCLVVFQIFTLIILTNEEVSVRGSFITDKSLVKYREDAIENSAVIVDDIMIHGRGVEKVYNMLDPSNDCKLSNIRIYVFKRCYDDAICIRKKLLEKVECDSLAYKWEWRETSSQLVNLIYACAFPYTSFIGAYSLETESFKMSELNNSGKFILEDNTKIAQRKLGEEVYILFEKRSGSLYI